jgi:hypothetical protein
LLLTLAVGLLGVTNDVHLQPGNREKGKLLSGIFEADRGTGLGESELLDRDNTDNAAGMGIARIVRIGRKRSIEQRI